MGMKIWECCVCEEPHIEIGWYRNPWGDIHMVCDGCRHILEAKFSPKDPSPPDSGDI